MPEAAQDQPPLLILLGPTASGKESSAALAAAQLQAEIVSCDSVKPYRRLEIAAAAPSAAQRAAVPHHLVGILDPAERLNAGAWLERAEAAFTEIHARGRRPLVVGGTALYLKALLFGLMTGPTADEARRDELRALEARAPGSLHARLIEIDPVSAERLHPNDTKRLLRAIEVFEMTGTRISERQTEWDRPPTRDVRIVGLRRARPDLFDRVNRRVDRMVAAGLIDEIRRLAAPGLLGPTATEAIGVKELLPLIRDTAVGAEPDPRRLTDALDSIRAHTRQLAKKQQAWFGRFPGVHWLDVPPDETPEQTATRVAEAFAGLESVDG